MQSSEILRDKFILAVDDEKDVLEIIRRRVLDNTISHA